MTLHDRIVAPRPKESSRDPLARVFTVSTRLASKQLEPFVRSGAHRWGCDDRGRWDGRRSSSSQRPQGVATTTEGVSTVGQVIAVAQPRHAPMRDVYSRSVQNVQFRVVGAGRGALNPERVGPERWARVEGNAPYGLRRGAWYPVLSVGPEEVVLVARHRPVIVGRSYVVDIVATQPNRWSVVARESGTPYAVCPKCAERVTLAPTAERMRCVRCQGWFGVERNPAERKADCRRAVPSAVAADPDVSPP